VSAAEFEVQREGDSFAFLWHRLGYAIGFEQLADDRWGLKGEIHVRTVKVAESTGKHGHVYLSRFNLSDGPEREKLANALDKKTNGAGVPWREMLEIACVDTLREYRRGAPIVDLARVSFQPQRYLTEGLAVPMGETSVFYGDGASCKSFLGLAVALSVRTGCEVGPIKPLAQSAVLTLDWETTEDEQAERLHRLCQGLGLANVPEFHYRPMWRTLADEQTVVRADVARLGVGLVLVDSIAPAMGGEVNSEDAIPFFNALRSLGSGVTRLVVSHISKATAAEANGPGNPFGSVFVRNLARSAWAVKATPDADGGAVEVGLFHTKVNRGRLRKPVGARLVFDDPTGPVSIREIDVLDNAELVNHASIGDRIYAALRGGSMTTDELVEVTGATKASVLRTLNRRRDEFVPMSGGRGRGNTATWGLAYQEGA
jgi:hypothetical protein